MATGSATTIAGRPDRVEPGTKALPTEGPALARRVAVMAGPVLVEQALLYLVGLSDTMLTGLYLSVDHLAAVINASYLNWFLGSLMIVVAVGATALVARLTGAGDRAEAARVASQSILMAAAIGTIILAVGWLAAPAVIAAMNLRGLAAVEAAAFLRIILLVAPLLACTTAGIACLRGAGDTRTGMMVMILVNVINVALSWALVTGVGPFPAWGLRGIATGTAVGEGVGGLVILAVLARGRSGLKLQPAAMRPDPAILRRILRISLPAAGEGLTNALCQLWFLGLINRLGPVASAAHGVAIRCEAIAFLTVNAFAVPASTLTGQYLGARRPDLAARAATIAWGMGLVVMVALGAIVSLQAESMFALFLGRRGTEVAAVGVPVLRLVAFALPALATINVLSGSLRGAGDTRLPWAFVLLGYLAVRLPLTYWLTGAPPRGLDWGLWGAWVAMFADLHLRAALVGGRFAQGGWKRSRV